jgi:hypothetical protein
LATNSSSTIRLAAFYTDEMLHQSEAQLFDQIYLFLAETASMPGPRAARETSANTVAPGQTPSRPGGLLGPLGRGGGFMLWPSLPAPPSAGFGMPW